MTRSREELLSVLAELGDAAPELRFGQMLINVATLARGPQPESVWDCDDDELIVAVQRLLASIRDRSVAIV